MDEENTPPEASGLGASLFERAKTSAAVIATTAGKDVSAAKLSETIGIGLPPKDKKFTLLLMKSLFQAWQLQMKLEIA